MNEKNKELTFESALDRLEEIVRVLEAGNISLEEALTKFEEGIELLSFCQNKLARTEERISVLLETGQNGIKLEAWNHEENSDDH